MAWSISSTRAFLTAVTPQLIDNRLWVAWDVVKAMIGIRGLNLDIKVAALPERVNTAMALAFNVLAARHADSATAWAMLGVEITRCSDS